MKIESNLSKLMVATEELAIVTLWGFGNGYYVALATPHSRKVSPVMVGVAFAVNEVVKYALNKLVENLQRNKLTPSRIKYIESANNLLIDAVYIFSGLQAGYVNPVAALIHGGRALVSFRNNIYLARLQSKIDYPFTAVNFKEKKI